MSYVTNALVACSVLEDDEDRMREVNEALSEASRGQQFKDISRTEVYGGSKHMEIPLWGAAFNYVGVREIMKAVSAAAWKEPQFVQVFICDQEDDIFTVRTLGETT